MRNKEIFLVNNANNNYLLSSPANTLMTIGNHTYLDLFFCSPSDIKTVFNV